MKENFNHSIKSVDQESEGAMLSNVPAQEPVFRQGPRPSPQVSEQLVSDIKNKKTEVEAIFDENVLREQVESPSILTAQAHDTQEKNKTEFTARKESRIQNIGTGRKWFKRLMLAGGLFLAGAAGAKAAGGEGTGEGSLLKLPPHATEAQVKAFIAARKAADKTPTFNMTEEIAAINTGKKGGMSEGEAKKLHDANQPGWEKHINELGYEKVVKN